MPTLPPPCRGGPGRPRPLASRRRAGPGRAGGAAAGSGRRRRGAGRWWGSRVAASVRAAAWGGGVDPLGAARTGAKGLAGPGPGGGGGGDALAWLGLRGAARGERGAALVPASPPGSALPPGPGSAAPPPPPAPGLPCLSGGCREGCCALLGSSSCARLCIKMCNVCLWFVCISQHAVRCPQSVGQPGRERLWGPPPAKPAHQQSRGMARWVYF